MRRYQFAALLIGLMWAAVMLSLYVSDFAVGHGKSLLAVIVVIFLLPALLWWRTGVLKYLTNRSKE